MFSPLHFRFKKVEPEQWITTLKECIPNNPPVILSVIVEYLPEGFLVARNETHEMAITEDQFDFNDYCKATKTPNYPMAFQRLVQDAIQHENCFPPIPDYSLIGLQRTLLPHQVKALKFALSRPASLLALDLGLGKTTVSYAYMIAHMHRIMQTTHTWSMLIVCPGGLKTTWKQEGTKCLFKDFAIKVCEIKNAKTAAQTLSENPGPYNSVLFLVSYSLLNGLQELLTKRRWDVVVFDEAHALQNCKSACAKAAYKIRKKTDNVVLLTGTPAASSTTLWNLLRFLHYEIFAKFFHYKSPNVKWKPSTEEFFFAERYVLPEIVHASGGSLKWVFRKSLRLKELYALTRQFVLCQKKEDVLKLPDLVREHVTIGRASEVEKLMMQEQIKKASEESDKKGQVVAFATLMEQVRQTAVQKLPYVLKFIHKQLRFSPNEKFIVWGYHKAVIGAIHDDLEAKKIPHVVVNGETSECVRTKLFTNFEHDKTIRIAVLSIKACGTGRNLAFVQLSIYAELTFLYKDHKQSEGRSHRIGQLKTTVLKYLIYADSTDDIIWKSMLNKSNNESIMVSNKKADYDFRCVLSLQNVPHKEDEEAKVGDNNDDDEYDVQEDEKEEEEAKGKEEEEEEDTSVFVEERVVYTTTSFDDDDQAKDDDATPPALEPLTVVSTSKSEEAQPTILETTKKRKRRTKKEIVEEMGSNNNTPEVSSKPPRKPRKPKTDEEKKIQKIKRAQKKSKKAEQEEEEEEETTSIKKPEDLLRSYEEKMFMVMKALHPSVSAVIGSSNHKPRKKFILSGGPGVGKTTLVQCLKAQGYCVVPEVWTMLKDEALRSNTLDLFMFKSSTIPFFRQELFEKQMQLETDAVTLFSGKEDDNLMFLDRSIIDIIAFAQCYHINLPQSLIAILSVENYDTTYERCVFFPDPIPKSFFDKCEKLCSFEKSLEVHQFVKEFYEKCGYTIVSIPYAIPQERVSLVLRQAIASCSSSSSSS